MTKISPFKAIRPKRDKAHLVATRPYYDYNKKVLKAKLKHNPYTFLHILNPKIDKKEKINITPEERFKLISKNYDDFIDKGILIQDNEPHFYIYKQTNEKEEFIGIIGGASLEDYQNNIIKKHEATIIKREEIFKNYLNIVGYNAEPVLLCYQDSKYEIESLLKNKTKNRPEYEFITTDKLKHELWLFNTSESKKLIKLFKSINSCYIADGHHRIASSLKLKEFRKKSKHNYPNEDFFLAFFINENRLKISEFNRFIKKLNGLSKMNILSGLKTNFIVKKISKAQKPTKEHEFTMFIDNEWFKIKCKENIVDENHPVNGLDTEILTQYILKPIFGISNLKTDTNIEFISGNEDILITENKIKNNKYDVGFFMFPLNINQVKNVADKNMTMPPKSTWVEPKLRSGLTIYNINE